MLPPSWKAETGKAVEEKISGNERKRQADQHNAATKIASAIESLRDAQNCQTSHWASRTFTVPDALTGITGSGTAPGVGG
jgi:hypothetical protein